MCDLRSIVSGEQGNRQSIAVMDSQALRILWCHLPNVSQTITTNPILRVKEGRVLVVTRSVSYLTNKRDKTVLQRKKDFFFRISSKIFVSVNLNVVNPCVVYNTNHVENRPNTTKFYWLYRTTCFDLFQVILRFTVCVFLIEEEIYVRKMRSLFLHIPSSICFKHKLWTWGWPEMGRNM